MNTHLVNTRDWRDPRYYQAPRTLDSAFRTARYATAIEATRNERIAGVLLACFIGVLLAAALVHWWAA